LNSWFSPQPCSQGVTPKSFEFEVERTTPPEFAIYMWSTCFTPSPKSTFILFFHYHPLSLQTHLLWKDQSRYKTQILSLLIEEIQSILTAWTQIASAELSNIKETINASCPPGKQIKKKRKKRCSKRLEFWSTKTIRWAFEKLQGNLEFLSSRFSAISNYKALRPITCRPPLNQGILKKTVIMVSKTLLVDYIWWVLIPWNR
jgi:hypothetical protein